MSNSMYITTPENRRFVDDYDFTFPGGVQVLITIDESVGDVIVSGPEVIVASLAAKASLNDPTKLLPAEETTIFARQLLCYQRREREILELTPEQQFEWKKTIKELNSTVQ